MKKKILALICMLVCVFSMAACSSETGTPVDSSKLGVCSEYIQEVFDWGKLSSEQIAADIQLYGIDGDEPDPVRLSGLESLESNLEDLGAPVSYDASSCTAVVNEEGQTEITAMAEYEKRPCKIFVTLDRKYNPTFVKFEPQFTFGQKMEKAGMNTLMGIGTVFIMLILISLVISCFKFIHAWEEKRAKAAENAIAASAPSISAPVAAPVAEEEEEEDEDLSDDLELVAVITAAIAAMEETPANGLVVRSIRRAGNSKWKNA